MVIWFSSKPIFPCVWEMKCFLFNASAFSNECQAFPTRPKVLYASFHGRGEFIAANRVGCSGEESLDHPASLLGICPVPPWHEGSIPEEGDWRVNSADHEP